MSKPPAVWTRSYSNQRDGCTPYESKLTSEYVQKQGIRLLGTLKLDDPRGTEGQPIVVPDVICRDGLAHDLVFVCDMSGYAYAFDLNTFALIWKQRLGNPVVVSKTEDMWGINPYWCILSTPVIDVARSIMYAVAYSTPDGTIGKARYWFHSISLADGSAVHLPMPMDNVTYTPPGCEQKILGSVPRKQRPALTLANGHYVYVAFGSFFESADSNNGWVVAIDVSDSPHVDAAWTTGGKHVGAGIWMAGEGLSVDDKGFLYAVTGNGGFDPPTDFGECVIKLQHTPGKIVCVDWWSPYSDAGRAGQDPTRPVPLASGVSDGELPDPMEMTEAQATNAVNVTPLVAPTSNQHKVGDQDLGSGGPLPVLASFSGYAKSAIIFAGKDGIAYVADEADMGKTMPGDFAADRIGGNYGKLLFPPYGFTFNGMNIDLAPTDVSYLPILPGGKTAHVHGSPVCYKSPDHGLMLFVGGENGPVRAFSFGSDYSIKYLCCGQEIASAGMPPPGGMPGVMMSLSCDGQGTNTGVLWALMPLAGDANKYVVQGRLVLYAANWDQNGTIMKLWDSAEWNWKFSHNKFNKATIWGGKALIPTYDGTVMVVG